MMSIARTRPTVSISLFVSLLGLFSGACGSDTPASKPAVADAAAKAPQTPDASATTGPATIGPSSDGATTEDPTTADPTTGASTTGEPDTDEAATSETADETTAADATTTGGDSKTPTTGGQNPKPNVDDNAPIAGPVNVVILRENGVGSAAQAQRYVDELVNRTGDVNNWETSGGKYTTRREQAESYISGQRPQFGILSLGGFLALRKSHKLSVVGRADVKAAGGQQYFIISADATNLAGCKGKKLASNHLDDTKLIEGVVAAGAFKLADFTVEKTRRPVQTLKKVINGEAACALVDDAQKADLSSVDGGDKLKVVWSSKAMPAMAVVAFGSAKSATRQRFKSNLGKVCSGPGKAACEQAGIRSLKPASDATYRAAIKAYGN